MGLVAAVVLFAAVNIAAGPMLRWARVDMTQGNLHSLSEGTTNIIQNLENTITLKLFWSEEAARDIPGLKVFARRVKETLQEYEARAGGKIQFTVVDTKPFSEEEDEPDLTSLFRLALEFDQIHNGRLRQLIDAINRF